MQSYPKVSCISSQKVTQVVLQLDKTMSASSQSNEVYLDFSPHLYVYTDGRVQRLSCIQYEPASKDPETGVLSEDGAILPDTYMTPVNIYIPPSATPGRKLPLLVYYHRGGFMAESTFSPLYHRHLNHLVSVANVVVVSVEYKLAPDHYLPIAYEESWLALQWVASQSKTDDPAPWVKDFANFDHVYLGGDSAGANIAHYLAMRVASERLDGIHLCDMFLNCPYFWGNDLIGNEVEYYSRESHFYYDCVWICCFPTHSKS